MRAGLICIDLQRGYFRDERHAAGREGLVEAVNALAAAFAQAGHPVIAVTTEHAPDGSTFSLRMRRNGTAVMLAGSEDAADLEGLVWPPGTLRIAKTRYSAYLRTPLAQTLRDMAVTHAVHCGAFTDGCVGLSAIDAAERDFDSLMVSDATMPCHPGRAPGLAAFAADEFEVRVAPAERVLAALAAQADGGTLTGA